MLINNELRNYKQMSHFSNIPLFHVVTRFIPCFNFTDELLKGGTGGDESDIQQMSA